MVNLSERALNLWADIFCEAKIEQILGVHFSKFLESPHTYLELANQETAPECLRNGFRPLLPVQAAASKRIRDSWAEDQPDTAKEGGIYHE